MGGDTLAVFADQGGDDVHVLMADIVMPVYDIGLLVQADAFHVQVGNGGHFFVAEFFGGVEVEGDVQRFYFGAVVEFMQALKSLHFLLDGYPVFIL